MNPIETIGVDLGGTKMAVGVLDHERQVLYSDEVPSGGYSEDELMSKLIERVTAARDARPEVVGVGLGIPARIDFEKGFAFGAVNLEINDVPVRDIVSEAVGLPTYLDNDGNVAMLAEALYGAAKGTRHAVLLTVGTGIGGGLWLDGRIYRGSTGAGAELGHIVIDADGPPCQGNCPGRGCAESMASGTALGREARLAAESAPDSALGRLLAAGESVDGRAATEAAIDGDQTAIRVLALIGSRLGVALTSLANVFQPETFVIGGGVIAAGELMLGPAREVLRARALDPMNRTRVVAASLGPQAGLIGASALARIELENEGAL